MTALDELGPIATQDSVAQQAVPRHKSAEMERMYLRALVGPEFRPVLGMVVITAGIGAAFNSVAERWGVLDSLYFSVVTLATIGYGDLTPATRIGKIFTILYVFAGVGILGLFLSTVARSSTRGALQEQVNARTADQIDFADERAGKGAP
jgi:voltage-gated potassium channel